MDSKSFTSDGEVIKAEIIGDKATGRVLVIMAEPEAIEAMPEPVEATAEAEAQLENSELAKKPARKGKEKKGVAAT